MKNEIIPYQFEQAAGHFSHPTSDSQYLHERTMNAIRNAWEACSVLDRFGRVWVDASSLHILLRTTKPNANYLVGGIANKDKYRNGSILYIRGTAVCQLLDFNVQNARSLQRENYIHFSELFYRAIRDCSRARELRAEFYEFLRSILGQLKQSRINKFNITKDELTNEELDVRTSEFSHIRSVSLYPEVAGLEENGLIVNKITHQQITQNSINDENELLQLCELNGWSTNWYNRYSLVG